MAACHLELMGLHDAAAYARLAKGVLQTAVCQHGPRGPILCGLNVPNKKPDEPLLEWAGLLRQEFPHIPLCVHYSLKHQRGSEDPVARFQRFCLDAVQVGVKSVLLVTGPRGPRLDALSVLEQLRGCHPSPGCLRLGVAFNACLPSEAERATERQRLVRKLKTGLVQDVWLNCGSDAQLLQEGILFARSIPNSLNLPEDLALFGSVLIPNEAQLLQMRERPWNGVHFGDEYLGSVAGMEKLTRKVLAMYGANSVVPIVESKVRSQDDVVKLKALMDSLAQPLDGFQMPAQSADEEPVQSRSSWNVWDQDHKATAESANGTSRNGRWRQERDSFYPQPRQARRWRSGGGHQS